MSFAPRTLKLAALVLSTLGIAGACTTQERRFGTGGGDTGSGATGGGGDTGSGATGGGGACPSGKQECDGDPSTVCETDVTASVDHCGACDHACVPTPHAQPSCVGGACAPACEQGYGDCDLIASNGCEENLGTSAEHCGTCDNPCTASEAVTACVAGSCKIVQCFMGYGDCDKDPSNGCEVDLSATDDHCGACDTSCVVSHATSACVGSKCQPIQCDPGWADCNQQAADGCERDLSSDPTSCGACGHDCQGGGCVAGVCQPIVVTAGLPNPTVIALNPANTDAFVGTMQGTVFRVPFMGGGMTPIAGTGSQVTAIAVNSQFVLFAGNSSPLVRVNFDGSGMYQYSGGTNSIEGIGISFNNNVYWPGGSGIRFAPLGGGGSSTLACCFSSPRAVAVDGSFAYWTDTDGSIRRSPLSTNATIVLTNGPFDARSVAVDSFHVYWVSSAGIFRTPTGGGGGLENLVNGNADIIHGFALDQTRLYWTLGPNGEVWSMPKDLSAPPVVIASGQGEPWGITVDATSVYWTNAGTGELMKLAK